MENENKPWSKALSESRIDDVEKMRKIRGGNIDCSKTTTTYTSSTTGISYGDDSSNNVYFDCKK